MMDKRGIKWEGHARYRWLKSWLALVSQYIFWYEGSVILSVSPLKCHNLELTLNLKWYLVYSIQETKWLSGNVIWHGIVPYTKTRVDLRGHNGPGWTHRFCQEEQSAQGNPPRGKCCPSDHRGVSGGPVWGLWTACWKPSQTERELLSFGPGGGGRKWLERETVFLHTAQGTRYQQVLGAEG